MTATFTENLLDDQAPWVTPAQDPNGIYALILTALASMFDQVFALCMDQGYPDDPDWVPGWGVLLDIDLCPTAFLPFLAQFVGATIPAGVDDATARQLIRAEQGLQRGQGFGGTYDSTTIGLPVPQNGGIIVSAAQRNLTGTQSVTLIERTAVDGSADAYHFVLVVRPEELSSASALTAAVDAVKPAGVQWTLVQEDAWTWSGAENTWSADTMTWAMTASWRP